MSAGETTRATRWSVGSQNKATLVGKTVAETFGNLTSVARSSRGNELHDFITAHRHCQHMFADAGPDTDSGYQLVLTCGCGSVFRRWVKPDGDALRFLLLGEYAAPTQGVRDDASQTVAPDGEVPVLAGHSCAASIEAASKAPGMRTRQRSV